MKSNVTSSCLRFCWRPYLLAAVIQLATATGNSTLSNKSQPHVARLHVNNGTQPVVLTHRVRSTGKAKYNTSMHRAASNTAAKAALTDFETAVTASAAEAVSAYGKISDWCTAQKSAFSTASDAQSSQTATLYTEITSKAGLRAQIESEVVTIRDKLAEQQNSRSSTMNLQYSEETAFEEQKTDLAKRADVLEDVMKKMKEKAFASDALAKAAELITTAAGISTVGSSKSPLSTLMGVLGGLQAGIEDELAKTKKKQKEKRAQFNELITSYSTEISTLEKSAETQADRLSTATSSLAGAKLEREACQGLYKEDNELLLAIATVCSEADFAKKKKEKVYDQFAADLKDARTLLEKTSFLMLRWQRHKSIDIPHGKLSAFQLYQRVPRFGSFKPSRLSRFSDMKAPKSMSTLEGTRRLMTRRVMSSDSDTPVQCKKDRQAATAELNSARYDVQHLSDAKAREEANETAYSAASAVITKCKEDDDLGTESATLKKEVEDFETAGKKEAEAAKPHLDTADSEVESYFGSDGIDAPTTKLEAQIVLARMRDTLKEWVDDGLSDLTELAKMVGQIGDRAVEIKDDRDKRAKELSAESQAATTRKGDLQTALDKAKSRLSSAQDSAKEVEGRCTVSLVSTSSSKASSDLQVLASQSSPWKLNGHLMPELIKVIMKTLGLSVSK